MNRIFFTLLLIAVCLTSGAADRRGALMMARNVATSGPLASFQDQADDSVMNGGYPGNNGLYFGVSITMAETGTATRLRLHIASGAGSMDLKMALYDNANNKLADGTVTVSATGYAYVTLSPSVAVTSGTTYKVAWEASNNFYSFSRLDGQSSGTSRYKVAAYASFPPDPLATDTDFTYAFAVGIGGDGTTP